MNCNLFTAQYRSETSVGRLCSAPLEVLPTFFDQFYSFSEWWSSFLYTGVNSPPFAGRMKEEKIPLSLPYLPTCQSMGKPNQFRLGRENLGRIDTCAHISHSSLSNLQIRYWEIFFWSMLTKFVLTVFICRERWVS